MRVLVATIVHTPLDARIHARQIRALVDAGEEVTYAAPWSAYGIDPSAAAEGITTRDLPRASGRDRVSAIRAARSLLASEAPRHDLVLVHDPDLLPAVAGLDVPVVWDVHEDTAGALIDRAWVPSWTRRPLAAMVRGAERWAEDNLHLILAEEGYRSRFRGDHPVVPNHPPLPADPPPPDDPRVVYLGRVSRGRGAIELIDLGRRLRDELTVEVIGPADADVQSSVEAAASRGDLVWHGFVPNERAGGMVAGAAVGLSLLHDMPNYRHSLPTKVLEYLGHGVPVVTTPLPVAADIVRGADAGEVVGFGDVDAAERAIRRLWADAGRRHAAGGRGRARVAERYSWEVVAPTFVTSLRGWARS